MIACAEFSPFFGIPFADGCSETVMKLQQNRTSTHFV
jgi:hypothetical protein